MKESYGRSWIFWLKRHLEVSARDITFKVNPCCHRSKTETATVEGDGQNNMKR